MLIVVDTNIFVAACLGAGASGGESVSALTARLPDDKHRRLKELAKRRHTSLNRLIDEMTTQMLAEFDAETRFLLRTERGKGKAARGLEILAKAKGGVARHR